MGNGWKVEVDRSVCIGSGMCIGAAPQDFKLDTARQAHPCHELMDPSDDVMEAAENCPAEAISITDAVSGEVLFPPE
jgi:ferredoxin